MLSRILGFLSGLGAILGFSRVEFFMGEIFSGLLSTSKLEFDEFEFKLSVKELLSEEHRDTDNFTDCPASTELVLI